LFVRENEVRELPADGSASRVVVADHAFDAAWSPDGTAVAYTSFNSATGRRRTSIADLQSGVSRVVLEFPGADSVEPAWSPDGRAIAVTRAPLASSPEAGAGPAVWVVDVAGGDPREAGPGRHPSWTPHGGLLFDCGEGLCTAAVDGSDRRVLPGTDKLHDAAWSSAGNLIAAVDNLSRLVLVRPDGTGRRVLADHVPGGVVWSPDGARVVHPVDPTVGCATQCAADPGLWSVRSDGGDRRRLTDRSSDRSPSAVPAHPPKGAGE
jgi:Tol biopolymer transport system component